MWLRELKKTVFLNDVAERAEKTVFLNDLAERAEKTVFLNDLAERAEKTVFLNDVAERAENKWSRRPTRAAIRALPNTSVFQIIRISYRSICVDLYTYLL
jgi:hypothetical protein